MKKLCEPLDLSRRDSVDTVKTPSLYSGHSSSLENSPSYSHEKRDTPSPNFVFFGPDHFQLSPYILEAAALQNRLSQLTPSSSNQNRSLNNYIVERNGNLSRPFEAYPRNPHDTASYSTDDDNSAQQFEMFRVEMLKQIQNSRGGQPTKTNPKMRRIGNRPEISNVADSDANTNNSDSSNNCVGDVEYYDRRLKNNAAAKKSRDRRRIKEDEMAIKAKFLENKNRELQAELASAKNRANQLKVQSALVRRQLAIYCGPGCPSTVGS